VGLYDLFRDRQPQPGILAKTLMRPVGVKPLEDSLQRILALYGYEVRVAYEGIAALELGRTFDPEIAVLDIGMFVHGAAPP